MPTTVLLPAGTGYSPGDYGGHLAGNYKPSTVGNGSFPADVQVDDSGGTDTWEHIGYTISGNVPQVLTAAVDVFDGADKTINSVTVSAIMCRVNASGAYIGVCWKTGSGATTVTYKSIGTLQTIGTSYDTFSGVTLTTCPWTGLAWTAADVNAMNLWVESNASVTTAYLKCTKAHATVDWTATAPAIPTAPSGLTATAVSQQQVNLAWTDASSNEDGFYLDRATNIGFSAGLVTTTVAANAITLEAPGLTPSTTYYFRLRAFNAGGLSANTETASATTLAVALPPSPPTYLLTTTISSSQINLSWTDNSNNETAFIVEYAYDAGFIHGAGYVVGANVTTYSFTGLPAATTFYFRVKAANGSDVFSATAVGHTATVGTAGIGEVTLSSDVLFLFKSRPSPLLASSVLSSTPGKLLRVN